ncbi:MAG: hypothetical protein ACO3UU_02420 [Minisyncoccia bacterium]|jgi:hypothetical protein
MANEITKSLLDSFIPTVAAATAMETLKERRGISRFVNTDFSNDVRQFGEAVKVGFLGDLGNADNKVAGSTYALTAPADSDVTITLNQHKHKSIVIEDVGRAQARPDVLQGYITEAIHSVLRDIDISVATLGLSFSNFITETSNHYDDIVTLRETLVGNKAPIEGPFIYAVSASKYADLLRDDDINKVLNFGGAVAQTANLPQVAGMSIFETQLIQSGGSPVRKHNMAFHKDAIGLAVRPLPVDGDGLGVKQGVYNDPISGLSIRLTMGYDNSVGGMSVRAEVLYGVSIMRQGLAVALREV